MQEQVKKLEEIAAIVIDGVHEELTTDLEIDNPDYTLIELRVAELALSLRAQLVASSPCRASARPAPNPTKPEFTPC